jgi:hypothetical protein
MHKLAKGNDIWALVAVTSQIEDESKQEQYLIKGIPPTVKEMIHDNSDLFAVPDRMPPNRVYDHAIPLYHDVVPVNCRPYRYSPHHKDEIEKQVAAMLKAGTVVPSLSPFASPILLVKKKDGSWRFCVDYRKLNASTIKNKFPMPIIDEFLDEISGAKFFTKLDMNSGFHQIRMVAEDEHKTAFKTHHDHFQFRVMPFGLTNAPATFQCLMNSIFAFFMRKFVLVFMDDILIFSKSLEEHIEHLKLVFQVLRKHELFVKFKKCAFAQQQIDYLGHIISADGVATDPTKTSATLQWPIPQNFTELRQFLGLIGYYRKFVHHYGIIAKPLTQVLQHKTFVWTAAAQEAFDSLKQAMSSTPVLALPDFDQQFVIEIDACDRGVGEVLTQNVHPIVFFTKALSVTNQKLSAYEKEFLVVLMAIDKWRTYLVRQPFLIVTDHKILSHMQD